MINPKIGQTTTDQSLRGKRDAAHTPMVLVDSLIALYGGRRVRFEDDSCLRVMEVYSDGEYHGVADPFVGPIEPGELFWVYLAPELVGELLHGFAIKLKPSSFEPDEPYEDRREPREPDWCQQKGC